LNQTNLIRKDCLGVVSAVYFSTAVNYGRKMFMKLTTGLATQVPVSDFVTKQYERQQRWREMTNKTWSQSHKTFLA